MDVVAWRGASHEHRENTVAAIKAVPMWVRWCEIDTQLTLDNVMVAFHNRTLAKQYDVDVRIKDHTYDALKSIAPDLARPEELMEANPFLHFILDVKEKMAGLYEVALERQGILNCGFYCHHEHILKMLWHRREAGKGVQHILKGSVKPETIPKHCTGFMSGSGRWGEMNKAWVKQIHEFGGKVFTFSGVTEQWMRNACELGVDAFLTNRFDRAEKVLREMDLWDTRSSQ